MIKMEHLPRHTTGLLKEVWDRKHRISEITNLNSNGDTARTIKLMLTGLVCMQCNWTIGVRRPVFSLICLSDLSGWVVCACVALALLLLVSYLVWSADLVERLAWTINHFFARQNHSWVESALLYLLLSSIISALIRDLFTNRFFPPCLWLELVSTLKCRIYCNIVLSVSLSDSTQFWNEFRVISIFNESPNQYIHTTDTSTPLGDRVI